MTVDVMPRSSAQSGGLRLLGRMCRGKFQVIVHPWVMYNRWHAFAYLITDRGREEVRLHFLGALIAGGSVRVVHVFGNGELLYGVTNEN